MQFRRRQISERLVNFVNIDPIVWHRAILNRLDLLDICFSADDEGAPAAVEYQYMVENRGKQRARFYGGTGKSRRVAIADIGAGIRASVVHKILLSVEFVSQTTRTG
jgi:hypothetical protein